MVDIARKIREIRKNLNMTQAQFAEAVNASQGSVSKWERGKERPSMEALVTLGKVSGFNLNSLRSGREHEYGKRDGLSFVEIVGAIQSNYGVEDLRWDEGSRFEVSIPTPSFWGNVALKGWIVKGRSAWTGYQPGTVIVAASEVDPDEDAEALMNGRIQEVDAEGGDIIVCAIHLPNGLREITLQRVVAYENGALSLWNLDDFTGPKRPPIPYPSFVYPKAPKVEFLGIAAIAIAPIANPDRLVYIPDDF